MRSSHRTAGLALAASALLVATACWDSDTVAVTAAVTGDDAEFFAENVGDDLVETDADGARDRDDRARDCRRLRDDVDSDVDGAAAISEGDPIEVDRPRWVRHRHRTGDKRIAVEVDGDLAQVSKTLEVEGKFLLDIDGDCKPGRKLIHERAFVNALYERARSDEDADKVLSLDMALLSDRVGPDLRPRFPRHRRHWHLVGISPVEFRLAREDAQTVEITDVVVSVDGTLLAHVTDPGEVLRLGDGIGALAGGESALVEVRVENFDAEGAPRPSRVFLHHRGHRMAMFDDGTHGDWVPDDGVFANMLRVPERRGVHHFAVDVIDAEVFADETTPNYNSTMWGLPYLVVPADEDPGEPGDPGEPDLPDGGGL